MATYHLTVDEMKTEGKKLRIFDKVYLSGTIYTARDAAHKRIFACMAKGEELPFPIEGNFIYYAGPTPSPDHLPIGSCGPTTSGRMDPYAPKLLDMGLGGMIGKGERNDAVKQAVKRNGAVYLCAIGGAGALACQSITSCEVIAFEDLGCESVKRLTVSEFPLFVAIDAMGNDIFTAGRETYLAEK